MQIPWTNKVHKQKIFNNITLFYTQFQSPFSKNLLYLNHGPHEIFHCSGEEISWGLMIHRCLFPLPNYEAG